MTGLREPFAGRTISRYARIGLTAVLLLPACRSSAPRPAAVYERGFYYWRTSFSLSPREKAILSGLSTAKLYLRFFDIAWSPSLGRALPQARCEWRDSVPVGIAVVPVVYFANAVFRNLRPPDVDTLAVSVWRETWIIAQRGRVRFSELQIDCDWTDSTRASFFRCAGLLRRKSAERGIALSATIRLHQVKYFERTGIPPVDRGMLMFYNMGELDAAAAHFLVDAARASRRHHCAAGKDRRRGF
jgi:hypothetical protein